MSENQTEVVKVGQRIQINGTNSKRKAERGIPVNIIGKIISISSAPGRPTIYNIEIEERGLKFGLEAKEFKVLG